MPALRFTEEEFAKLNIDRSQIQMLDNEGNVAPASPPPEPQVPQGANRQTFRPPSLVQPGDGMRRTPPPPNAQPPPWPWPQEQELEAPRRKKRQVKPIIRMWQQVFVLFFVSCLSVMFVAVPGILLLVLVGITVMIVFSAVRVHPE